MEILILGTVAIGIWLLFQRWFWLVSFAVAGLASCFAMLASIIHFQIVFALGYFFLMVVFWAIAARITTYV
jgi:hypothetical protein